MRDLQVIICYKFHLLRGGINFIESAMIMEKNIVDMVETIRYSVVFMAIGGSLAIVFFFVFAPGILGLKSMQNQLRQLGADLKKANEKLEQIADSISIDRENQGQR
jgi:hypothetical protein